VCAGLASSARRKVALGAEVDAAVLRQSREEAGVVKSWKTRQGIEQSAGRLLCKKSESLRNVRGSGSEQIK
jgi:hypothetical protein